MARPPRWQATLDASVEEACLAVRLYNDPAESASGAGHRFVYRFAAGAYACRGGDELLSLINGDGDPFFEGAQDVSEAVSKARRGARSQEAS